MHLPFDPTFTYAFPHQYIWIWYTKSSVQNNNLNITLHAENWNKSGHPQDLG